MSDINIGGMALADGVVETLVTMAVKDVDGVAAITNAGASPAGIIAAFQSRSATRGVEVQANDDGTIAVSVRIEVYAGNVLTDVADAVRQAVADAVMTQLGIEVSAVDIYIDGLQF